LIRFVWTRLVHAPYPSKLVYIDSYSPDYLIGSNSSFVTPTSFDLDLVRIIVSVSFDAQYFSPGFSYEGRTIATPFLSAVCLEEPERDCRLLGNCIYSPGLNRSNPWSFKDFFTGADALGYYDFKSESFGEYKEVSMFSKHAIVKYYVIHPFLETKISSFFDGYDQARMFARRIFSELDEEVGSPILLSIMVRSCIRCLKHPMGFFAHVKTMAGSIKASELLFEFKKRLMSGGDI